MRRKWQQSVKVVDGIGTLSLVHPDGRKATHLFDADLIDTVRSHNWLHEPAGYAASRVRGVTIRLHWLPFSGAEHDGNLIDHIDRDRSNSQRNNLRIVSKRGNHHNQTNHNEYGPCIRFNQGGYRVQVRFDGRYVFVPKFKTLALAEQCRDAYLATVGTPDRDQLKAISDGIKGHGKDSVTY